MASSDSDDAASKSQRATMKLHAATLSHDKIAGVTWHLVLPRCTAVVVKESDRTFTPTLAGPLARAFSTLGDSLLLSTLHESAAVLKIVTSNEI